MQNRNMFLYRRQGPKKRTKPGPSRKNRGPQKGLPNSARDLLPLIQPATKALAQMLAGRTQASGQLGHARAVLAQTERLVADRSHNRLNPSEREEFFEQVARLKLTLADAESEAEVEAQKDETPAASPTPVNRERLKEMAMALTSPSGTASYEDRHKTSDDQEASSPSTTSDQPSSASPAPEKARKSETTTSSDDPNQLRLPRGTGPVAIQPDGVRQRASTRRRTTKTEGSVSASETNGSVRSSPKSSKPKANDSKLSSEQAAAPAKSSAKKLPKGWIIDEEGFVVPGPAA